MGETMEIEKERKGENKGEERWWERDKSKLNLPKSKTTTRKSNNVIKKNDALYAIPQIDTSIAMLCFRLSRVGESSLLAAYSMEEMGDSKNM